MLVLGLTGSAAMGKSTVAAMIRARGVPVFDADSAVHRLYEGAAVPLVEAAFPGVAVAGGIDRDRLRSRVLGDEPAMRRLEAIVHPLVKVEKQGFLSETRAEGRRLVVLDVPLLFETGADAEVDMIVVVSAPADIQQARLLARPGMTRDRMEAMLARQVPDAVKRSRAHFVIENGGTLAATEHQVDALFRCLAATAAGR